MKVHLRGTRMHYDKHRTLVFTAHVPNWFERVILRKKMQLINYVGRGTKWSKMSADTQLQFHAVKNKKLLHQLSGWGEGEVFYQRNQNLS